MKLCVQPLTLEYLDEVFAIETSAHIVPWSRGVIHSCLENLSQNPSSSYVNLGLWNMSDLKAELIGFAISQVVVDEATLFNLAIAPNQQGQGLGRYLLTELIQKLNFLKVRAVWLEVRASNASAIHLYQNQGFETMDIRKNYYPTLTSKRENAWVMRKELI